MSWGNTDDAANSVFYAAAQFNKPANTANRTALFGNTTMGAFVNNAVVGQFGVSAAEVANTSGEGKKVPHAGWNIRVAGTGSVQSLVINNGGSGYTNTHLFRVTATGTGSVNATGTVTTNSTGGIVSLTLANPGSGFITVTSPVAITNATGGTATGTNANVVATVGGRAGRVSYETLVAMGSIVTDASDDTQLPE